MYQSNIFEGETLKLSCSICGKDEFENPEGVVFFLQQEGNRVIDIILTCEETFCSDLIDPEAEECRELIQ
jgi:hypothetical protein